MRCRSILYLTTRQVPMASHARHARSSRPSSSRGLVRVGLTVSAGAAIVAGGAGAANAAPMAPKAGPRAELGVTSIDAATAGADTALGASSEGALRSLEALKLNPLAGTGSDPFANAVGTQVADFEPVSTSSVTEPLTNGGALRDLALLDQAAGLLPPLPI
ncbi:hypothetical protein [Streptomyces olivoreticuli]|uniref:hypothetical protein n=1 Tax=Streptomyces olivoreticuli TaxID=68246 RepID=UPI0030B814A6